MDASVDAHFEVLRRVIAAHSGDVVKSTGDGVFATFERPSEALRAAATVQREVHAIEWPVGDLRVRMGIHTGECIARGGDRYGRAVNKAARLEQAAYGGQVLVSEPTAALVRDVLDPDLSLAYLGEHHFDGILDPARVYQLSIAGLPSDYPPLRTRDIGLERLPPELTPLVGRSDATRRLLSDLRGARLLTLVGPPGVGKSRLAVRVAAEEGRARDTGVRFVDLTTCRAVDATDGAVANALGIRPEDGTSYADAIVRSLRPNDTLVVLDNCEHLLAAVRPLVDRIVTSCPRVTILATSRERLDLPYEGVWPVPTLTLPARDARTLADLTDVGSAELLIERARASSAHFSLTEDDVPALTAICRRCDGLPLALQLAAARLETLSPRELLTALDESADVLRHRDDVGPAHESLPGLNDALDASYAALTDEDRILFDRFAVFAGFATAPAVAAVCGGDPATVKRGLDRLVRRSLVEIRTEGGWTRYGLLESIRQYAQSHARVDRDLEARHSMRFAQEAVERGRQYRTGEAIEAARALAEHFDDFRLALQRLRANGSWGEAVDMVLALHEFCMYSMRPELHTWALELDGRLPPDDPRSAELKGVIALGAWLKGNHQQALALGEEALRAAAQEGSASTIWARTALLDAWGHIGDLERAADHLYHLRKECLATGDPYWMINAYVTEAIGMVTVGLHEMARRPAAEAVRLADELGNPDTTYWAMLGQAMVLRPTDLAGAEAAVERSLAATRVIGSRWNEGLAMMEHLGILVERGRTAAAAATALDLLIHLEAAGLFGRIWHAVLLASKALADVGADEPAALLLAAVRERPVVPEASIVSLMSTLEASLTERLGEGAMARLATRAGFLSDTQVLERCREELEALLRT